MTKEEFEQGYAEQLGMSVEWLRETFGEAQPCDCDYDDCQGWRVARVDNRNITGGSERQPGYGANDDEIQKLLDEGLKLMSPITDAPPFSSETDTYATCEKRTAPAGGVEIAKESGE